MKKVLLAIAALLITLTSFSQAVLKRDLSIEKAGAGIYLKGTGAFVNFYNSDVIITQSENTLTVSGGNFALSGGYSLLLTGSIGITDSRVSKIWATDIESTNMLTVGGVSLSTMFAASSHNQAQSTIVGLSDSLLNRYTKTQITTLLNSKASLASPTFTGTVTLPSGVAASTSDINDTITARLAGGTVGVALADSNKYDGGYATPAWVDANAGGGNADSAKIVTQTMQFITGVTAGAPENGDSIIASSYFEDKNLKLYVNGERKYYNTTTTNTVEGFRFVTDTGIIVKPPLATNDQVIVEINDATYWTTLAFDHDLLDGLVAYYKFDETSGTNLTDEIGGNTATLDGDINQTGIINQAVGLTANNDDIVIPYSEGVTLGESEQFSVSMWFYADDLPSTVGRSFQLFQQNNSVSPLAPHRALIGSSTDKIYFWVRTDAPSDIDVISSDAITADAWHHVVFVCPGSGGSLQMWLDGVDVSTSAETVDGNLSDGDQYLCVGNAYNAATAAFYGKIDEFAIYNKVLTESEILKLYNSGSGNQYPFE